jgi:hypothetical protein
VHALHVLRVCDRWVVVAASARARGAACARPAGWAQSPSHVQVRVRCVDVSYLACAHRPESEDGMAGAEIVVGLRKQVSVVLVAFVMWCV